MSSVDMAGEDEESGVLNPNCLPAGCCFCPTDRHLVAVYLPEKLEGDGEKGGDRVPFLDSLVPTVDLYGDAADPWRVCRQLAYPYGLGTTEFYCFTPRRQKYGGGGGSIPDRTAGSGTWTANGRDKGIYHQGALVGHMTNLTFKVPPPGSDAGRSIKKSEMVNTHWVMHEYRLQRPGFQKMVVCRVRNLKKEREEADGRWSPPWWEQQEGGGRGGGGGKKRKVASLCEDAEVLTQRQRRRGLGGGDSKSKGRAIAAPSRDLVLYMDDSSLQRQQPITPAASAAASHQDPFPSAISSDDKGESFSPSFTGKLYAELLEPSQENTYYPEALLSTSTCSSVLQKDHGLLCPLPTGDYCSLNLSAAAVLAESSAVLQEPFTWDAYLKDAVYIGESSKGYYMSTGMITSSPEDISLVTGSTITGCEDWLTRLPHDCIYSYADEFITPAGAAGGYSIPTLEMSHFGDVTSDVVANQLYQSHSICSWEQLVHHFSEDGEEYRV